MSETNNGLLGLSPKPPKPAISSEEVRFPKKPTGEEGEQALADTRLRLRQKAVNHPGPLEAAEAETYATRRIAELDVDAVAELEYALKYGSEAARERARDRILEANGHGKKDKSGGPTQLIIVNGVVAGTPLPWAKPVEAKVVVEPAKAIKP